MLIVHVNEGGLERSLKVLKKKTAETGIVRELRDRQRYTKPSVRRRAELLAARYRESLRAI
jgi:small subunit ribosomal protein S21